MPRARALKNKYSGVLDAQAACDDCEWSSYTRTNALANGSLHARRTGHTVRAEQTIGVTYNRKTVND